jgi:hypothetical protein
VVSSSPPLANASKHLKDVVPILGSEKRLAPEMTSPLTVQED